MLRYISTIGKAETEDQKRLRKDLPWSGEDRLRLSKQWVAEDGRNSDDLNFALSLFEEQSGKKEEIVLSYLAVEHDNGSYSVKDGRSFDELVGLFPFISRGDYKSKIALSYLATIGEDGNYSVKDAKSFDELAGLLPFVQDSDKSKIVSSFIKSHPEITYEQLRDDFVPLMGNDDSKSLIVFSFIEGHPEITYEQFRDNFIPLTGSSYLRPRIIAYFIECHPEITSEQVRNGLLPLSDDIYDRSLIACSYLVTESEGNYLVREGRSFDELKEFLPMVDDESNTRSRIVLSLLATMAPAGPPYYTYLAKDGISFDELRELLPFLVNNDYKSDIALSYLAKMSDGKYSAKDGISFDELVGLLPFVNIDDCKLQIISSFIKDHQEITSKQLRDGLFPVIGDNRRREIFNLWIGDDQDKLLDAAKEDLIGGGRYDIVRICDEYKFFQFPEKNFPEFCKNLYNLNEDLQVETCLYFLRMLNHACLQDTEVQESFLNFVKEMSDDDRALELLQNLKTGLGLNASEVINITNERLSRYYSSCSELLKSRNVADSLSEEGLEAFEKEFAGIDRENISLVGLFSYYNMSGAEGVVAFKSMLKPEVLNDLRQEFTPSSEVTLIWKKEYDKMKLLLLNDVLEELPMPQVGLIAGKLSKSCDFKNYDSAKIDEFSFGKSGLWDNPDEEEAKEEEYLIESKEDVDKEENKKQLIVKKSEEFRLLLKKDDCTKEEVAQFFEDILQLDEKINDRERKSLFDFFNKDKFLLAKLLEQDGGVDKLRDMIYSLGDGCFANIGSNVRIAVVDALIADPYDRILFSIFNDKFSHPVLAASHIGVDHPKGDSANSYFTYNEVNKNYFPPTALVKMISEEFYKDGKIRKKAIDVLKDEIGVEEIGDFLEKMIGGEEMNFDQQAANFAAYFIIKSRLPELTVNPYLKGFFEDCEEKIGRYNQKTEEEAKEETAVSTITQPKAVASLNSKNKELGNR